jgi:hypothetical protein
MPKIEKAERRDKKQHRDRNGMRVSGRSVKALENIILRKAEKAAREKEKRERKEREASYDTE